jgi:ubiquinone/menaquinone biosynthesis C-methylase UbiE
MDVTTEGKFASFYDFFLDGALKPIRLKNLEIISKHHCEKIIDLGCGTGSQCRILSKQGFEVVGIDSSEKMLKVAKKKNMYKTTFILGDITENIVPHETFDCAIITLVLHTNNRKTIKRILEEAKRITKKNGFIIIADYGHGIHFKGKLAALFIRFIESFTNSSHRTHYFEFMRRGALQAILSEEKYQVLESLSFYDNALNIRVVTLKDY